MDAFRKSGIFPLDRAQITDGKVKPSLVYSATTQSTSSSSPPSTSENSITETSSPVQPTSFQSTSSPCQRDAAADTGSAFDALENSLSTPTRVKYRRHIQEGYNLPESPAYRAWKSLYRKSPEKENASPLSQVTDVSVQNTSAQVPNPTAVSTLGSLSPTTPSSSILDDILVYPSAPENAKKRRNRVIIPNFMTSETSMKILLDQKLKKAREVTEKQKQLKQREEKREVKQKEMERKRAKEKKK